LSDFDKAIGDVNQILGIADNDKSRHRPQTPVDLPDAEKRNELDKNGLDKAKPSETTAAPSNALTPTTSRVAIGNLTTTAQAVQQSPEEMAKAAAQTAAKEEGINLGRKIGTAQAQGQQTSEASQAEYEAAAAKQAEANSFKNGYVAGFNQGYAIGLEAVREKARQDKAAAQEAMKTTAAYQDGQDAGMNDATNPTPENKAVSAQLRAKYIQPVDDLKAKQAAEGISAPSPTAAQSQDYQAFLSGNQLGKEKPLVRKGYLVGFNAAYATKLNADQVEKAKQNDPKTIAAGEYKPFFEAGKANADSGKPLMVKKMEHIKNEAKATLSADPKKAEAAYIYGYNSGLMEQAKAKEKNKPKAPVKFRHGVAVGNIIGLLTAQGGEENIAKNENIKKLLEGQKLPTNDQGTQNTALAAAPTLQKLKIYLANLKFLSPPAERPRDLSDTEKETMKAAALENYLAAQAAFDDAKNMGTPEDFERGYTRGYNQGYAKGLGKKQGDKANTLQNAGKNDPDFKAGYEDGQAVGQLAAETNQKAGTPETKAAFQEELTKVKAQSL
jgi:hypothetical protein